MWKAIPRLARREAGLRRARSASASATDGPITAADLEQRVGKKGSWWSWDDGKIVLEYLFHRGEVVGVRRRRDFARALRPARAGAAGERPGRADADRSTRRARSCSTIAARSLGVATLDDLADYHRQRPHHGAGRTSPSSSRTACCCPATVEGWTKPAYVHRDATVPRAVDARALLSPFDSLVWHRDRNERLFDFHYRIEIYTPAPKRIYGYYVLPFLLGDRLVGRVDLKADRAAGVLRVQGAYVEPGVDAADVAGPLVEELRLMAGWLELDTVATTSRASSPRRCSAPASPAVDAEAAS